MYKLIPIGKLLVQEEKLIIRINKEKKKCLIGLKEFSHIHVFYIFNDKLYKEIFKIELVDINEGKIFLDTNKEIKGEIIDIKPYFPSEDRIKEEYAYTN